MQAPPQVPSGGRGGPLTSLVATSTALSARSSPSPNLPNTSPNLPNTSPNHPNTTISNYKNSSSTSNNNKSVAFNKQPASPLDSGPPTSGGGSMAAAVPRGGAGAPPPPPTAGSLALRAGPRLRAEGLMVPPASDAATLRRQVAALQIDLEAHIDGEQRLQSINHELRERLELYMKQNHENVERAETELNTLHEDMEQTLELQRRLAQRAQALEREKKDMEISLAKRVEKYENERALLQTRLSAMSVEVREKLDVEAKVTNLQAELTNALTVKEQLEEKLINITEEATYLKKKTEEYTDELRNLVIKEQKDQKVKLAAQKSLARRYFIRFQEAIRDLIIDRANERTAQKHYNMKVARLGFRTLRMATGRSCLIGRRNKRLAEQLVQDCWRVWRIAAIAMHKGEEAQARRAESRLSHSLHSWVAYVIRARKNPQRYQMAQQHLVHTTLLKAFRTWNKILRTWKLNEDEEHKLSIHAWRHHRMFVERRAMSFWRGWLKSYARPQKKKLANVQAHINKMIMKQAMTTWRCVIRIKWLARIKFEAAKEQDKRWLLIRTMARFKRAMDEIVFERQIEEQSAKFQKLRQGKFVVKNWKFFVQQNRHMKIRRQVAFRHYLKALSRKTFKTFRECVAKQKAEKRAAIEVNQCLMRASMVFWRDYHVYHLIKKKKIRRAMVYKKRRELKNAKKYLVGWWEQMAWRRRALHLDSLLAVRLRRTLLVSSLHSWMHATFDGLLVANAKFHEDLVEAQSQFEEQKYQVSTVDVENLQLIDRLHSMSSEIAYLKTTINERAQEADELHRALEDAAVLESSMRGEIEQQHVRVEELQNENRALQRRIQTKNVEDTAGEVHQTLELQNMEQALQELRIQLAERNSQLDSYEKALKETAERLEGASDESQEKLTSAFEIAGSLRKLLEDRDNQYATLEGNSRRRELELGEVQRKLAVANCTLCETVETRDARIQELENMLSQKQAEVLETQTQLQDLELALDAKESHVRKLEYEITLMSEPHALKARKFVSSLSSYTPTPAIGTCGHQQSPIGLQSNPYVQRTPSAPHSPYCTKHSPRSPQRSPGRQQTPVIPGAPRLHTIQVKESMRHAYAQAKQALAQSSGASSDDGGAGSGMRSVERAQELQSPRERGESSTHPAEQGMERTLTPTARGGGDLELSASEMGGMQSLYFQGQDTSQRDWETSFALVSTTRPASTAGGSTEPSYATSELGTGPEDRRGDPAGAARGSSSQQAGDAGGPFRMVLEDDQGAVDSLHVEIQRLQARIMSRLRDPPNLQGEDRSGRRPPQQPPPQQPPPNASNSRRPSSSLGT